MQENRTFIELLEDYDSALKSYGLGCAARLDTVQRAVTLIHRHEARGERSLSRQIVSDFFNEISDRFYKGEIKKNYANTLRRQTERFVQYVQTGEVRLDNTLKGSRVILPAEFQRIVDAFLESDDFHPNTRNDMRWVAHKYFEWLAEQGYKSLRGVGAGQIQKFLLDCAGKMAISSIHNVKLYLAKLYLYLYKSGQSESSYQALLSFTVNRGRKVQPVLQKHEIAALLESIDRRTDSGKRAYAVMLLGVVLGLRACDVVNLKLGDIDWINGEIKILQCKTAVTVVLPLTKDVGEALRDYILTVRPRNDSPQVFFRLRGAPEPLKSAVTIGDIYRDCCSVAGLPASKK